jgi:hypothetical protein
VSHVDDQAFISVTIEAVGAPTNPVLATCSRDRRRAPRNPDIQAFISLEIDFGLLLADLLAVSNAVAI